MAPNLRERFRRRIKRLPRVEAITFESQVEHLISGAEAVVAMGGYNTFCEILSFDKRALIVPRHEPRREQLIRGQEAQRLGLVRMLSAEHGRETESMVDALQALPDQPRPSEVTVPGLLDGLEQINGLVDEQLQSRGFMRRRRKTERT